MNAENQPLFPIPKRNGEAHESVKAPRKEFVAIKGGAQSAVIVRRKFVQELIARVRPFAVDYGRRPTQRERCSPLSCLCRPAIFAGTMMRVTVGWPRPDRPARRQHRCGS